MRKKNWKKINGLIPAIVQHDTTGQVLMLGYMNEAAYKKTVKTRRVWFYSRSKNRLWMKGESSRNILKLVSISPDCDGDALLVRVKPTGPTCHTGAISCFAEKFSFNTSISELFAVIEERKQKLLKKSYSATLFKAGLDRICAKIAEESGEVIKAATKESKQRLIEESVDLLYHLIILLVQKEISMTDTLMEIKKRRK